MVGLETIKTLKQECWGCGEPASPDPTFGQLGYYSCSSCELMFAPELDLEKLRELYDDSYFNQYPGVEEYESDDSARQYEADVRLDWMAQWASDGTLLEVGSATGVFLDAARSKGFAVVGVEPAKGVAQRAIDRYALTVHVGLIEDVELQPESFDVVCGWHVLEHITRPRPTLQLMGGLLRPGGRVFFEVPNFASTMSRRLALNWMPLDPQHHVSQFGPSSLRTVMESAGFHDIQIDTIPFALYTPSSRAIRDPKHAAYLAKYALTTGLHPRSPHPSKHELLRVTASKP
ncbi:MAG: class I SAM-dependent methyltransferase [Thermoleophilaceae bacterium]|nr:class I SAM-dependent methyltransferase [Thermoleophilaceae bacterium]